MSWSAVGLHLLALLVYPGVLLILIVGFLAEGAAGLALGRDGMRAAVYGPAVQIRNATAGSWPLLLAAALLTALAATQLAVPANPLAPLERNLLVAAFSLAATIWLCWARAWSASGARASLVVQACWLVALLSPALLSETLRPQVLGAVAVPAQLPLKAMSGLLYLVCLPVLLLLAGDIPGPHLAAPRILLWMPFCGLGVSLFLPPAADDVGGSLRFVGATLCLALVTIAVAALLRQPLAAGLRPLYLRLASVLAGLVLVVAVLTAALTSAIS